MENSTNFNTQCQNCGSILSGLFCSECGEKKLNPKKDFKLSKFIEQTIDGFTHFDSKFFKSFALLLFSPGKLTKEYITGRRVKYMKPIQIFLIISLLFYIILPSNSAYFSNLSEMNHGYVTNNKLENIFHFDAVGVIKIKSAKKGISQDDLILEFGHKASEKAKGFFFVLIPLLAIVLLLLFNKVYPYYVIHMIFSMHSISFFLLFDLLYIKFFHLIGIQSFGGIYLLPLLLIYGIHLFCSMKQVYNNKTLLTFLKTFTTLVIFTIEIILYRELVTIFAIELL